MNSRTFVYIRFINRHTFVDYFYEVRLFLAELFETSLLFQNVHCASNDEETEPD